MTTVQNNLLVIGHGNGHNETSLVEYVKDANADSFGAQEAQTLLPAMRKIPKHRVTVAGEDWTEARNRAQSTMIITKSARPNIGEFTRKVSERIPQSLMVAPDRVLVCSMYEHPVAERLGCEGVAHFALHPDAGPQQLQGNDPSVPIVREYKEAMESTVRYLRAARQDGLVVVLTGDLQLRAEFADKPWHPVNVIARPLGMRYFSTGLDWCLFDKRLRRAGPMVQRKLFDHTGFRQSFMADTLR